MSRMFNERANGKRSNLLRNEPNITNIKSEVMLYGIVTEFWRWIFGQVGYHKYKKKFNYAEMVHNLSELQLYGLIS